MKKFFSVFLTILLTLILLATLCLGIVRKYLSFSTITGLARQMVTSSSVEVSPIGLYYPNQNTAMTTQYQLDPSQFDPSQLDLSSISLDSLNIASLISQYAPDADIDPEFLEQMLEDKETTAFEDYVVGELVDYMTGVSTELTFDSGKIETFVNKTIDKYEDYSGETVDRTGLHDTIAISVEKAAPEITAAVDDIKAENAETFEQLKPFMVILKPSTFIIAVCVCVVLALLILLVQQNIAAWLKAISWPAIIDGVLLFAAFFIVMAFIPDSPTLAAMTGLPEALAAPVLSLATTILLVFRNVGMITAVIGIALIVVGNILGKRSHS